ncbi:MAG: hypothetical protein R2698_03545 [Microthrixaceae bacterium]
MRSHRLPILLLALTVITAACGGDTDNSSATADGLKRPVGDASGVSVPGRPGTGTRLKCPTLRAAVGTMRVVNLAVKADGTPVGPVDVYAEGYGPDQGCTPVVKALDFGAVSDYVKVPSDGVSEPPEGRLSYSDAGTTDRSGFWKGFSPNDGVGGSGDQETVVLSGGSTKGETTPTFANVIEHSAEDPTRNLQAEPGKAVLLVDGSAASAMFQQQGDRSTLAVSIDGRCPVPDGAAGAEYGSLSGNGVPYSVEPGTHTVGIIVMAPGVGIGGEDCDGATPVATESVDVDAGQARGIYFGGTSPGALQVLVASIDI